MAHCIRSQNVQVIDLPFKDLTLNSNKLLLCKMFYRNMICNVIAFTVI